MARAPGEPRVRYIGFRVESARSIDRKSLIEAIRRTGRTMDGYEAAQPWLTRFDGDLGIVRATHTGVATTRALLERLDSVRIGAEEVPVRLVPLATSGTIRTLTAGPLKALRDTGRTR